MNIETFPERVLQKAAHRVLADTRRRWRTTNGQYVQVLSPGTLNVHAGPDYAGMALLCEGAVNVASGEFHVRSSDWHVHQHSSDRRYAGVALHVVIDDDRPVGQIPWTIVLSVSDLMRSIRSTPLPIVPAADHVDELQRAACVRLTRHTDHAKRTIERIGVREALRALTDEWFDRMAMRKSHPISIEVHQHLRSGIADSALGQLAININSYTPMGLLEALRNSELQRIAVEGRSLRREILMNVIYPCCCAVASDAHLVVLFQWFWSVPSIHHYAALRRRFPGFDQSYMWQQQGLLEYVRWYSPVYTS
jgi:hypothetical protein